MRAKLTTFLLLPVLLASFCASDVWCADRLTLKILGAALTALGAVTTFTVGKANCIDCENEGEYSKSQIAAGIAMMGTGVTLLKLGTNPRRDAAAQSRRNNKVNALDHLSVAGSYSRRAIGLTWQYKW